MKISLGTLKDKGEELAEFLEPRVGTKPSLSGDSIEIEDGSVRQGVKPRQVKTYIKRFMYIKGVRKNYRVFVAGKELTVQELELGEEAEKKKEEEMEKIKKAEAAAEKEREEKPEVPKPAAPKEGEAAQQAPEEEKPKKAARRPRAKKK